MTKYQLRLMYWDGKLSFHYAISQLMLMGFTEFAAQEFLFAEAEGGE